MKVLFYTHRSRGEKVTKNKQPSEDQKRALRGYLNELGEIIEDVQKLTEETLNTSLALAKKVDKIHSAICKMRIEQDVAGHLLTIYFLLDGAPEIAPSLEYKSTLPDIIRSAVSSWELAKPNLEKLIS
jgi:hypothetical protein